MAQTNEKKGKVEIITQYKRFKKSEYVSQEIFNRLLNGLSERALFQEYLEISVEDKDDEKKVYHDKD